MKARGLQVRNPELFASHGEAAAFMDEAEAWLRRTDTAWSHLCRMAKVQPDPSAFRTEYEPGHPSADAEGYVKLPNVNTLVEAETSFQVERYRLLNEPWEAESICLDILTLEPDNQEALILLLYGIVIFAVASLVFRKQAA